MDPSGVRSGFDAELALSERNLEHLLLLAMDAGVIPTQEEIEARIAPLSRFELDSRHFGRLQQANHLTIEEYDLIYVEDTDRYDYRDHYVPRIETTRAKRLADNLLSKPRFKSTPTGPVFL